MTGTYLSIDSGLPTPAIDVEQENSGAVHCTQTWKNTHETNTWTDSCWQRLHCGVLTLGRCMWWKDGERREMSGSTRLSLYLQPKGLRPHARFKKDEILVKVSTEACLQPFLFHSQPAEGPFTAQYWAWDTFCYQEVLDGSYSFMTVVLKNESPWTWCNRREDTFHWYWFKKNPPKKQQFGLIPFFFLVMKSCENLNDDRKHLINFISVKHWVGGCTLQRLLHPPMHEKSTVIILILRTLSRGICLAPNRADQMVGWT